MSPILTALCAFGIRFSALNNKCFDLHKLISYFNENYTQQGMKQQRYGFFYQNDYICPNFPSTESICIFILRFLRFLFENFDFRIEQPKNFGRITAQKAINSTKSSEFSCGSPSEQRQSYNK